MTPYLLHPLLMTVAIPLIATLAIRLLSRMPNLREAAILAASALLCADVWVLLKGYMAGMPATAEIIEVLPGLTLALSVEPLGLLFALIASFLWCITTLYSIGYMRGNHERHQARFYACFAIAIACAMGIAFADNLFTMFVFYEGLTLSTYPLVTHSGSKDARASGRVYIGTLVGSSIALLLLAIVWTWNIAGTLTFVAGGILAGKASATVTALLLLLFVYGIAKAALMPLHRWLPAAMVAPAPVSALLHAVAVVKAGVFAIVKVIVYVFGTANLSALIGQNWLAGGWLPYLAGITILLASIIALRQDSLKLRLAYSTISQLAYVTMSAAILAPLSVTGAALHIAAHAFGKITLFFAAGAIYTASKKTHISQLGGIGRRMPFTIAAFAVGVFSMIGLPPTLGFTSKWYMLMGAWGEEHYAALAVFALSTLLNAAYFLPILYSAFFGKEPDDLPQRVKQEHGEAPLTVVISLCITATAIVALFFMPDVFLTLAMQAGASTLSSVPPVQSHIDELFADALHEGIVAACIIALLFVLPKGWWKTLARISQLAWAEKRMFRLGNRLMREGRHMLSYAGHLLERTHSPEGPLSRTTSIGNSVIWVGAMLGAYLVLYYAVG